MFYEGKPENNTYHKQQIFLLIHQEQSSTNNFHMLPSLDAHFCSVINPKDNKSCIKLEQK